MKDDFDAIIERANALTSPRFGRTGVFATDDETKEIAKLAIEASTTPVILLGDLSQIEYGRSDLSQIAWGRLHNRVDELAVSHGLPALDDKHYGFDAANNEFLEVRRG